MKVNIPSNLNPKEFEILQKLSNEYAKTPILELTNRTKKYTKELEEIAKTNGLLNLKLAQRINDTILKVEKLWTELALDSQYWLKGAIAYYFLTEDEEDDISSAIGFDDDAEVLNACLRLAELNQFIIRIEDFD
ncbi:MAG: hypothetical protein IPQ05_05905 [Leptospiraceae bacterium]|nr:hypothetical protein [Leptospiraceae bacterium]MBL0263408.1 hypothetical protein [Leptospiraceae bacterium]